jgi:hypothetical protein
VIVLWEASDRICGKRLKALFPVLLPALERHEHLRLEPAIRAKVTAISATTIDRLLHVIRTVGRVHLKVDNFAAVLCLQERHQSLYRKAIELLVLIPTSASPS